METLFQIVGMLVVIPAVAIGLLLITTVAIECYDQWVKSKC